MVRIALHLQPQEHQEDRGVEALGSRGRERVAPERQVKVLQVPRHSVEVQLRVVVAVEQVPPVLRTVTVGWEN